MKNVAIVSGANSGIGKAIALTLLRANYQVAMLDVYFDSWTNEQEAFTYICDITKPNQVEETVSKIECELGPVCALVNSAGVLVVGSAIESDIDEWNQVFAVNATGVFLLSIAVAKRMTHRRSGSIVTIASNAARIARSGMAIYAASKAAATHFTKCLGLEVADKGIRCNVISPGTTDTPMVSSMIHAGAITKDMIMHGSDESYRPGIPLKRIATPNDIASVVCFLLSDDARHVTLQDWVVDGGATLGA